MRDAETISRRALLGGVALAVGAAATISASRRAAAQPGRWQVPRSTEGTAALRNLLEFPASERVPVRREPNQSERLVSVLCGEGKRALTAQKPRRNSSSFAECVNVEENRMSEETNTLERPDLVKGVAVSDLASGSMMLGNVHGEPVVQVK